MSEITATAVVTTEYGGFTVLTRWAADAQLDRTDGIGFAAPNARVAARLVRAINAGAVFTDTQIKTDTNGHTYVSAQSLVMGRTLNADLTRLGY
jgi:hypothetical protein